MSRVIKEEMMRKSKAAFERFQEEGLALSAEPSSMMGLPVREADPMVEMLVRLGFMAGFAWGYEECQVDTPDEAAEAIAKVTEKA